MRKTEERTGNFGKIMLCTALAATVAVGGIMAYFTDSESVTNTFTVGKVSLDLEEPGWDPPEDITPNEEIEKDPHVINDGTNSEFIFLEVEVPYKNVIVAEDDGTRKPAADTELFTYAVNSGWTEIGTGIKDTASGIVTHLYVYGTDTACTSLEKDQKTPNLFDSVRFVNVIEGQDLEESTQHVVVNAYGIQTSDIDGGKTTPTEVWNVLTNQLSEK